MRKLIFAFAGVLTFAAIATTASALSPGSLGSGLRGAQPAVVQVHSGGRACHKVRGVWRRDTRPNSTRCRAHHRYWYRGLAWYRR